MILTRKTPLPVFVCCQLLGLSKASFYRKDCPRQIDTSHDEHLKLLVQKHPRLGYRQLAHRAGLSSKKTRSRLERLSLMKRPRRKKVRTTYSVPVHEKNLCKPPVCPGELLVSDFTYIPMPKGFIYLAVTVDVFSRRVRGYALSRLARTDLVTKSLEMASTTGSLKPGWIHHSDRGCQYVSSDLRTLVESLGGRSSFSKPASPGDNAFAESFFARFKDEEVRAKDYQSFEDALGDINKFIHDYNTVRKHSSLGDTTPCQYEDNFLRNKRVST
jgi:putative transposase